MKIEASRKDHPVPSAEPSSAGIARSTLAPWLLRLFNREYVPESEIQRKHRQMIELIWTRSGMGERYFVTLQPPGVTYGLFVRRVTGLVCRAAQEGWITIRLPVAPAFDDDAYGLEIHEPERFVAEIEMLFTTDAQQR